MKILFDSHLYGGHAYTKNAIDIIAKKLRHSVSNRHGNKHGRVVAIPKQGVGQRSASFQ